MKILFKSGLLLLLSTVLAGHAATTVTTVTTNITAAGYHSLFVKSDGSLWGFGEKYLNTDTGMTYTTNRPEMIVSNGVMAVAAGGYHTLFVRTNGSLWAMGNNWYGELGDGTFHFTNTPEQIVSSGVMAAAGGEYHSLFVKTNGSLWVMGYNDSGQLGDSTTFTYPFTTNRPEQIVPSGVVAVAAGNEFSLFIKTNGSLWGMGFGEFIGDGTFNNTNTPEEIVSSNVTAIAAGVSHSLFIKSDGSLWAMGNNSVGQLGDGTYTTTNAPEQIVASNVVAIAAGYQSLFLKSDGSLWAMGDTSPNRPVQIVPSGVTAIAAGHGHSLFLKSDGSLWAMGYEDWHGQLGDGFLYTASPPEQIVPSPQPVLMENISSGTDLLFNGTCFFGDTYSLVASPDLTRPLDQWTPVWTNSVLAPGTNNFTATLTNAATSGGSRQFYILKSL